MGKILSSFLCGLVLVSCVSTQAMMDSWLGKNKQELIAQWGLPTQTGSDGGMGQILMYSQQKYIPARSFHDGYGGTSYTPAKVYWEYKFIYVNLDGIIYRWLIQRQEVPPTQIDLRIYRVN